MTELKMIHQNKEENKKKVQGRTLILYYLNAFVVFDLCYNTNGIRALRDFG